MTTEFELDRSDNNTDSKNIAIQLRGDLAGCITILVFLFAQTKTST